MSDGPEITLACLDLDGATLVDDGGATETAYTDALATMAVTPGTAAFTAAMSQVHSLLGRPELDVFRQIFPSHEPTAQAAALAFRRAHAAALTRTRLLPRPGAEAALDKLRGAGISVCVISGHGSRTLARLLDTLDWWSRVDLAVSADDTRRGRPHPDPILLAALRLGIADVHQIAVCADTQATLTAGHRGGASILAGVPSPHLPNPGPAGATHALADITALPDLLLGQPATAR